MCMTLSIIIIHIKTNIREKLVTIYVWFTFQQRSFCIYVAASAVKTEMAIFVLPYHLNFATGIGYNEQKNVLFNCKVLAISDRRHCHDHIKVLVWREPMWTLTNLMWHGAMPRAPLLPNPSVSRMNSCVPTSLMATDHPSVRVSFDLKSPCFHLTYSILGMCLHETSYH